MAGPTEPDTHEFICRDCGTHVVRVAPVHANDDDICAECAWLRAVEDDTDRAQLRAFILNKAKLFTGGGDGPA